jgi:hypothetical protein
MLEIDIKKDLNILYDTAYKQGVNNTIRKIEDGLDGTELKGEGGKHSYKALISLLDSLKLK